MRKIGLLFIALSLARAAIPEGYYDAASGLSGSALKSALHQIIDEHTEYSYSFLWTALIQTDEDPNNTSNFILMYTGRSLSKTQTYPDWNREHTWPKSHGDFGETPPAGTDMHHLRPTDVSVNSDRGNKDFDNGGTPHAEAIGCYYDSDSWEARDEVKGDIARMMFYMEVRYEGDSGEPDLELVDYTGTSGPNLGKLSTLLAWHVQDPVSDFERTRNDRIYGYQNNRNPFVDHPEYAAYIWGGEVPETLPAPLAEAASDVDSVSFRANWSAVPAATSYKLYVSGNEEFTSHLSAYSPGILSANDETVTGLRPGTDYFYRVKAATAAEESAFSNIIHVRTLSDTSGTPGDTVFSHLETFANFPVTGSSYSDGSFSGQDGSTWTYKQCRGDIIIEGETPCFAKSSSEVSMTSGVLQGGISTLSFQYKQAFSSDVALDVYANGNLVATLTSSNEQNVLKESGNIPVNIEEGVTLRFVQKNSLSGQVAIDNIRWNPYIIDGIAPIAENFMIGAAYPNPFNPDFTLPLTLQAGTVVRAALTDINGTQRKLIYTGYLSPGEHRLRVHAGDLPAGIYFLSVEAEGKRAAQKLLLIK